jgi:hypothetical protein
MTFAVAAGYGIAICVATAALIRLSSVMRPAVVARSSARRIPEPGPLRPDWTFRQEGNPMIKAILVPAMGSDTDAGVFATALAVARPFGAHLDFLDIRIDTATIAAATASEGSGARLITDLIERTEEEAEQRANKRQNSCSRAFANARD